MTREDSTLNNYGRDKVMECLRKKMVKDKVGTSRPGIADFVTGTLWTVNSNHAMCFLLNEKPQKSFGAHKSSSNKSCIYVMILISIHVQL